MVIILRRRKIGRPKRQNIRLVRTLFLVLIAVVLVGGTILAVYIHDSAPEISVCLDPGHGDHDPGAISGDRQEKDDNLRIALLVRDNLEAKGIRVYMTRDDDTFLSLEERCALANKKKCTLFVALHRNSAESGSGVEVWVENTPEKVDWALAENILNGLSEAGISKARGVKSGYVHNPDGNYYVNAHTKMPSCLVELGFITSNTDNALFDEHLNDYAKEIADAIEKTLQEQVETTTA